jgi:DNA-binding GntR family transcriptional regulator
MNRPLVDPGAADDADLSMLAPIGRETLVDQVYGELRRALMAGLFRPGQALTLRSVSEALGVSHMPVRGALHRLEAEGALGAPGARRRLVVPELRLSEFEELRDIRIELEGLAAERAAASVTPAELKDVRARAEVMGKAAKAGDVEAYTRENWAFHTAVYKASHMPQLLAIIEALWLRIGPHVRLMMPDKAAMVDSMPNHLDVVTALERQDGAGARASIAADIRESAAQLRTILKV